MEFGEDREMATERVPCQFCNRKFAPESLVKHSSVCEKTLNKKRKTFDSAKQRIQGTELAEFAPTNIIKKNENHSHSQVKEKHIPVTRLSEATHHVPSRKSNKIASPVIKNCNYERCPHCDRSFGPKAFDRHIEWCKEQSIRINMQSNANREAKERLEARTKYRPSFKSKRSITREKYSSKVNDLEDYRLELGVKNDGSKENEPKIKSRELETRTKGPDKLKPKENNREVNFIRQNVLRCSYKSRQPKRETKAEREKVNNDYLKKSNFSEIQDWISANGTKIKPSLQSSKMSPTSSQFTGSIYDEDYDPFIIAEHQMKELFDEEPSNETMNQTYTLNKRLQNSTQTKEDRRNKCGNKENISYIECGPVKTKSSQTNDMEKSEKYFKTSPTSAFSKYSPQGKSDKNIARVPTPALTSTLEKEDFNFLPPITSNTCKRVPSNEMIHDININRYPLISLSNLSLCSSVSVDIPEENNKLGMCKSAEVRNDVQIPLIKRSISATNDKPNRNTIKKNLRMEHLLYGNEEQNDANSTITPLVDKYDEKLSKLNSLLDDENLDLMNSFAEFENALQESCCDNDGFSFDSELQTDKPNMKLERGDSMASKMSIDSAYNSLNRKSPLPFDVHNFNTKTSTPEADALKSSTHSLSSDLQDGNAQIQPKLSKFCHECGARFPLAIAKYCCECGVRRLVI